MLPMVATMLMGSMGKQVQAAGFQGGAQSALSPDDIVGKLSRILDADGDGSIFDNLLGLARKFF
jgi:hypothetical protein